MQSESKISSFVFDINQGNKEAGWVQTFLHGPADGKTLITSSASLSK